jgi:type II secretory pathway pseudopilin PulG
VLSLLRARARARANARRDERGFTIIEVTIASAMMLTVLAMFLATLQSLTTNEDRSQLLVRNKQNVRFELDQLARDVRAANPVTPLSGLLPATAYNNQIEVVLGPTGGTQTVVRWTYDTVREQMVRQVMSDASAGATIVSQAFFLSRVRNVETGTPVFAYYGQHGQDLVATNGGQSQDVANCAIRVHIVITSDSNPGPVPFTETQDVEVRNRLPGGWACG